MVQSFLNLNLAVSYGMGIRKDRVNGRGFGLLVGKDDVEEGVVADEVK
jgi:hypothetical protein